MYQCASLFCVVSCFLDISLKAFFFLCNTHLTPSLCAVQPNNVNESSVLKLTWTCIFKYVKCIIRNSQRMCIAFSIFPFLKWNLSSSTSHVCVLQITCAGNVRFAAASSLIKKSRRSEMLLFKMWMSLLMTVCFPTFLHPSHMGLHYQLFRGFLGLN